MELEPKTPSRMTWWWSRRRAAAGVCAGMAPMMALAERYEAPDELEAKVWAMNTPIKLAAAPAKRQRIWKAAIAIGGSN